MEESRNSLANRPWNPLSREDRNRLVHQRSGQMPPGVKVSVTATRFNESQAIVDFLLMPGAVTISMPVQLPPDGYTVAEIHELAWVNLSTYLNWWAQVVRSGLETAHRILPQKA